MIDRLMFWPLWAALLLAACVVAPRTDSFSGMYTESFEVSSFLPCSESVAGSLGYWLSAAPESDFFTQISELRTQQGIIALDQPLHVYIEARGEYSAEGRHGHMGAYTHELIVSEVLLIDIDGSCAP